MSSLQIVCATGAGIAIIVDWIYTRDLLKAQERKITELEIRNLELRKSLDLAKLKNIGGGILRREYR